MADDIINEIGTLHQEARRLERKLRDAKIEGKNLAKILKEIAEVLDARNEYGPRIERVQIDGFTASHKRGASRENKNYPIPENDKIKSVLTDICDYQDALEEAKEKLRLAEERADSEL